MFGVSKPEHIGRNAVAAIETVDASVLDSLTAASDPVKAKIGANCDMWDSENGGRYR